MIRFFAADKKNTAVRSGRYIVALLKNGVACQGYRLGLRFRDPDCARRLATCQGPSAAWAIPGMVSAKRQKAQTSQERRLRVEDMEGLGSNTGRTSARLRAKRLLFIVKNRLKRRNKINLLFTILTDVGCE